MAFQYCSASNSKFIKVSNWGRLNCSIFRVGWQSISLCNFQRKTYIHSYKTAIKYHVVRIIKGDVCVIILDMSIQKRISQMLLTYPTHQLTCVCMFCIILCVFRMLQGGNLLPKVKKSWFSLNFPFFRVNGLQNGQNVH